MSTTQSSRVPGISRVLAKLEEAMKSRNFYESHQIYRTLYFRYLSQKKFAELLDLLNDGATRLLVCEQYSSGADLSILLIEVLEKSGSQEYELWINRIAVLISKIDANVIERETLVTKAIKWSSEGNKTKSCGHPLMHKLIANILCNEGNFDQARQHYMLSKDGVGCGTMLVEISQKKAYANEVDLIIAQVVFQLLCLKEKSTAIQTFNTYVEKHPKIQQQKPPFHTPLLNFLYFMMVLMDEANKLVKFNALCKLYKPTLDRDVAYEKQIQMIKEAYFGAQQPRQQAGEGGIFGQFINTLFNHLSEDSEDEEAASPRAEVADLD